MKLPRGTLKLIAYSRENASSNASRARAGSARLKPVWIVYVMSENGTLDAQYMAFNFRASSLNPRHEPLGLRKPYPNSTSAMRRAFDDGVWFETRSELTIVTEQEVPEVDDAPAVNPPPAEVPQNPINPEESANG